MRLIVLYELGRVLQILFKPLNIGLFLIALILFLLHKSNIKHPKIKLATYLTWFLLSAVLLLSNPLLPNYFSARLERKYATYTSSQYPEAGAIVVLGGTTAAVKWPRQEPEELGGGRLLAAARLYKAGKSKLIIVTGGEEYVDTHNIDRTQPGDMKEILIDMGIPKADIIEETGSRNTHEDVQFTAALLEERNISSALLVTSAIHMNRAMAFANLTSVKFIPVPIAHEYLEEQIDYKSFIPELAAIQSNVRLAKEYLGSLLVPLYKKVTSKTIYTAK